MKRLTTLCVVFFTMLGFAAVEHGTVFPITETAQNYSANDNYYDSTNTDQVRFSYTPTSSGLCTVTSSYTNSSFYRYLYYYGTDDTFSNREDYTSSYYSPSISFDCKQNETYYFIVYVYYSSGYSSYFDIKAALDKYYYVTIQGSGKTESVLQGNRLSIKAPVKVGERFIGWKIETGTGTFGNAKNIGTTFTPTSDTVTLSYDVEEGNVYLLSDVFVPYTYASNGSAASDGYYGVRTVYEPSKTGLYTLISKGKRSHSDYYYDKDSTFASRKSYFNISSAGGRSLYSLTAGEKYYFLLYQSDVDYYGDTISVRMAPTFKVNADTVGGGYAYVGTGSRNYDSSYVANDTVPLSASSGSGFRFSKWEKVSGTCTILDTASAKTGVVINSDCKVRAVFKPGVMYPITKTKTKYTPYEHYFSGSPTSGVRFTFVAPADGGYIIKYEKDSTEWSYFRRYKTSYFSSYEFSRNTRYSVMDTVLLKAGDSVFYTVSNDYLKDSLLSFSMSYDTISSFRVTVDRVSPECSTTVESQLAFKGMVVYFEAYAQSGFRPDGWSFVSGSHKFRDSSAYSIGDTIYEDTKLKLGCRAAKIIDITDKPKNYTPYNDFYEKSPGAGIRFRYVAPTTGVYVLRFRPYDFDGLYRYYDLDSTFTTAKRSNSTSGKVSYIAIADSAKRKFYVNVAPYTSSYWGDSFSVVALPAAFVQIVGNTRIDTIAVGDSLDVSKSLLDYDENFVKWTVVSGKGHFIDSTSRSTQFIPDAPSTVKIEAVTRKLPVYELTDVFKTFTFNENSSYIRDDYYGIRTVFEAPSSGTYAVIVNSPYNSYIMDYAKDSTFYSFNNSFYCYASYCKYVLNLNNNDKRYLFLYQGTDSHMKDTVLARVQKTVHLYTDTAGVGYAYVGAYSRTYDSTYVPGDTVSIRAATNSIDHKFSKWSVSSGNCSILDSSRSNTYIVVKGDCKVKAHFVEGSMYPITDVATKYTTAETYYSRSATYGTRFFFVAPSSGSYSFIFTGLTSISGVRYPNGSFSSSASSFSGYTNRTETLSLSAGDSVFYNISNYYRADSTEAFWVSYSQSKVSIVLLADSNGSVTPSNGYSSAWVNAAYPITANPGSNYRFDRWKIEFGTGVIDDPYAMKTVVIPQDSIKVRAYFKRGEIYPLTSTEQVFNFQKHHYSVGRKSSVMFSWTPADTNHYLLKLDSVKGQCVFYGMDSLLTTGKETYNLGGGASYIHLQGNPGNTYYLSVTDSVSTVSRNVNFTAQIIVPNVLYVESTRGRAIPSEYVYVAPGVDTALYVIPYGGYFFDSWTKVSGTVTIANPSSSKTRVEPQSSYCHVKANYILDSATVPEVSITNLDISNHPSICAQVSVVDKRNGRPIAGLDSSDFILSQDNLSLSAQTTTIQSLGGVSVALVVDESGSMSGSRMIEAKNAIRQFINEMGPYDRTAIVGFTGGYNADVHQTMTSDKNLLLNAVNKLSADGPGTNINMGTKVGVDQVVGETNPTAVIVFSDGANNDDVITTSEVLTHARGLNTTIYSIAVETPSNSTLKNLAEGSGGTFTDAPSASQLASIYSDIRGMVQSRYVLCYQSPDAIWDGDSHMVEIKTKFLHKDAADTAYWDEGSRPPVVELTPATWDLVGVEQLQNVSLTIDVFVRAKTGLSSVVLYTRNVSLSNGAFESYEMTRVNDTLWRYVIPDSKVQYPGIDFYVVATDSNGLTGKAPAVANPLKEPYTIPVKNNVPVIKMDSLACVDTVGGKGTLRFNIIDDNKINSAMLYYKDSAAVLFDENSMKLSGGFWVASIASSAFEHGVVEIYVRAVDGVGASVRWPKNQNVMVPVCGRKYRAPDVPDTIKIVNADSAQKIVPETEKLNLTLVTEDFTNVADTVNAKLSCLISGDVENNIKLVEIRSGYYVNPKPILKNEKTAKKDDGTISCIGRDTLVAEYKDPLYGTFARDTVVIVYSVADVPDTIKIVSADTSKKTIGRKTDKLNLNVVTEDFSKGTDAVKAKLSCLVSGDVENDIELVEKRSGYYETRKSIPKNEKAVKKNDGTISCSGRDTLVAEYKDPLYGSYARDTVVIKDSVTFSYKFLDAEGKKDLETVESGDSAKFKIRLTAFSKSIHVKDTLDVLLYTDKGDSLWVKAIETDNYSSTFEYSGTFNFVYDKKDLKSSKLDALFDLKSSSNRVTIKAKVKNDNLGDKRKSLVVYSNYIPADIAEIYDADKDGKADSIRIHFIKRNTNGFEGIDSLFWNKAGGTWRSVAKKKFKFVGDSSWVEARLEKTFDYGATTADKEKEPYLKLSKVKGGFAQKLKINDKVGAVPVKAVKRPGVIGIEDYMECSQKVPPDTLEITLSEPVKKTGKDSEWKKLFTYSTDCKDTVEHSLNISKLIEADSTGRVWKFVLGDYKIVTDNCIRTNPKANYTDKNKNSMGRGGIKIEGSNGNLYLYEVVPTPAVSGIPSKAKWIAPDEHDWSPVPDTLSVVRVASIMPYKAKVIIYDGLSNVVASFTRKFGEKGEMDEKIRGNEDNHAKIGFLHWNNRSDKGRKVGTGVYIWRIDFKFKDGHSESRLVKTGFKRKK